MKKIGLVISTFLLALFLVSCNKNKFYAKAEFDFTDGGRGNTEITFKLKLIDPDSQVQNRIYLSFKDKDNKEIYTNDFLASELKEKEFTITGLKIQTKYTLIVTTTYNEKQYTLLEKEISTNDEKEIDITTVEDFLAINENRYATYNLKNDIDFKDVDLEEIRKKSINNFSGIFNGNGFAIKNYHLQIERAGRSRYGLFGELTSEAKINDLVIDNFQLTIKDDEYIETSRYIGVLFGDNNNNKVEVNNVTIKNSKIDLNFNTTSTTGTVTVGVLGGRAAGKYENITIENTDLNLNFKKIANVYIGGVIGTTSSTEAKVSNILADVNINVSVEQNEKDGLVGEGAALYVGGFIAETSAKDLTNAIINANININKLDFVMTKLGTKNDNKNRQIDVFVGGLFARLSSKAQNMIYSGNIELTQLNLLNKLTEEENQEIKYKYLPKLRVAGLIANSDNGIDALTKLIRSNSEIKLAVQDENTDAKHGLLVASGRLNTLLNNLPSYKEVGYFGTVNDTIFDETFIIDEEIQKLNSLQSYFENISWIIDNLS